MATETTGLVASQRTTNNSYEPATGCVRHFWFEPAEQYLFSGS
jgi:hypothetical protein